MARREERLPHQHNGREDIDVVDVLQEIEEELIGGVEKLDDSLPFCHPSLRERTGTNHIRKT